MFFCILVICRCVLVTNLFVEFSFIILKYSVCYLWASQGIFWVFLLSPISFDLFFLSCVVGLVLICFSDLFISLGPCASYISSFFIWPLIFVSIQVLYRSLDYVWRVWLLNRLTRSILLYCPFGYISIIFLSLITLTFFSLDSLRMEMLSVHTWFLKINSTFSLTFCVNIDVVVLGSVMVCLSKFTVWIRLVGDPWVYSFRLTHPQISSVSR